MSGRVALGGELREVSVLFCDIRGFTPLTQNMDPAEVIRLLNEHMTALSRVVYEHEGVVDQFVGDLIMAVFGAPVRHERDAYDAARCALRMIEERQKLNETSLYRINIGIGVATGGAVAVCMGSNDRNNYTVLGERVNLASRLCGKAGKMEVLIDETTRARLGARAEAETLPGIELKGFSGTITAFWRPNIRPLRRSLWPRAGTSSFLAACRTGPGEPKRGTTAPFAWTWPSATGSTAICRANYNTVSLTTTGRCNKGSNLPPRK
jgi:class 3 adenylate cyclase